MSHTLKTATGLADASIVTLLTAPSEGAQVDRVLMYAITAGAGAATAVVSLLETGTTKALAVGTYDLSGAAATVTILQGNGVGATAAGTPMDIGFVFTGTTTTQGNANFTVVWLP